MIERTMLGHSMKSKPAAPDRYWRGALGQAPTDAAHELMSKHKDLGFEAPSSHEQRQQRHEQQIL
jgi:hypothetical protein